ncbi:hypothetical protein AN642_01295 [Epulopiscium sp. SCG-B10WGA-EpuloA2]|nr:hypothetical protein AN642_01295 [Epulopiscium sp. SCG-B10WGA-EpuloA2]
MTSETSKFNILDKKIQKVIEILTQIETITGNENQILSINNEDIHLDLIEEMSKTKQALTDEVESVEKEFETLYFDLKSLLHAKENSAFVKILQDNIKKVLDLKNNIILLEKTNMDKIGRRLQEKFGTLEIPKSRSQIINSYKQH